MADVTRATHRGGGRRGARWVRRMASAALADVCAGERAWLPDDPVVWSEFVAVVRHHRVAALAHARVRDEYPELARKLRSDRESAIAGYLQSSAALARLGEILGDTPWLTFKGPVLSAHAHPVPGLRHFHDIDLLVAAEDLRDVTSRLRDAGWDLLDRDDMLRGAEPPGEIHWMSPTGALLDLHWSVINMAPVRRRFAVSTAELLAARVRTSVGSSHVWTLSPTDTLVHVCLHAALTGADRMNLLLDADQLARTASNWEEVLRRARQWGAGPAVGIVLARAQRALGTPLPAGLMRSLGASAGVRTMCFVTDLLSPVTRLRSEASIAKLVARSARPTGVRTVATFGARSARGLVNRMGPSVPKASWGLRPRAADGSLLAYLRAVEAVAGTVGPTTHDSGELPPDNSRESL